MADELVDELLRDVLDHRQAAGHVAVEGRVADRGLALVAGREDERAAAVRDRHQQVAADPRLDVLGREPLDPARRRRGSRRRRPSRRRSAGRAARFRGCGRGGGRRPGSRRSSAGRASPRRHAVGAERVDGDQRDERGVDAAGEAEDDRAEAVLLDVVAEAEEERGVDLVEVAERLLDAGPRRGGRRRAGPPRTGVPGRSPRRRRRRRSSSRRRRGRPGRRRGCRTRSGHRARAPARRTSPRARAGLPRRYGDAEGLRIRRAPALGLGGGRRAGLPEVLADRQARLDPGDLGDDRLGSGLEVARLVEDRVVRQPLLAIDGGDPPAAEQRDASCARGGARGRRAVRPGRPRSARRSRRGRRSPPLDAARRSSAATFSARKWRFR